MSLHFESNSPEDTLSLGEKIGRLLQAGDTLLLFGDLGSGKTTLTQGIARGLEVDRDEYVRSPSFTLVNEYRGKIPIFHIDLYRIDSTTELEELGLEEVFATEGIAIVEWAEKLFAQDTPLPELGIRQWIEIHISQEGPDTLRKLELKTHNMEPSKHPVFTLH